MSEKLHNELFQGTTLSSLLHDIYDNSGKKKKQIEILVNELRPLIKDVAQAAMVVPLIKEYLDVGVRNDELLVKMAGVYQKFLASEDKLQEVQKEHGSLLTEEEKKQLLSDASEVIKTTNETKEFEESVNNDFDKLNAKAATIKKEIKNE